MATSTLLSITVNNPRRRRATAVFACIALSSILSLIYRQLNLANSLALFPISNDLNVADEGADADKRILKHKQRQGSRSNCFTTNDERTQKRLILLEEQVRLATQFQALIHNNQHTCRNRIWWSLVRKKPMDGFTLELQWMARQLQAAIATDRTFIVAPHWKSAYVDDCPLGEHWLCLWQPLSNCTATSPNHLTNTNETAAPGEPPPTPPLQPPPQVRKKKGNTAAATSTATESVAFGPPARRAASRGIIASESDYFDVLYHGSKLHVTGSVDLWSDGGSHVDHIPEWEMRMGRFWIRSQLLHYLWKPSHTLQAAMQQHIQKIQASLPEYYIGMHIRLTDSSGSFEKHFGRNASVTRSLESYLAIATQIRNEHRRRRMTNTNISTIETAAPLDTIFLATDSSMIVDQVRQLEKEQQKQPQQPHQHHWNFVLQRNTVKRSDSSEFMWFKDSRSGSAATIATDVHFLKTATYLIGSYQSNVFRLAVGLNQAHFIDTYLTADETRFHPVDVEYYEDP